VGVRASSYVLDHDVQGSGADAAALPVGVDEQTPQEVRAEVLGMTAGNAV
jgi:hypothetical protein